MTSRPEPAPPARGDQTSRAMRGMVRAVLSLIESGSVDEDLIDLDIAIRTRMTRTAVVVDDGGYRRAG